MRNIKGFMLLEVMLSLAILSFGLLIVIHSFRLSLRGEESSKVYTTASFLLERKLWEIEGEKELSPLFGEFSSPYEDFSWKGSLSSTPVKGILKITLTVFYKEEECAGLTTYINRGQKTEDISHQSSVISHQSTARRRDKRLWTMDYGLWTKRGQKTEDRGQWCGLNEKGEGFYLN